MEEICTKVSNRFSKEVKKVSRPRCVLLGHPKKKGINPMANPLHLSDGPNGIRTRVTDVRGQCPRPLDDGTTSLIQFQIPNVKFKINSAPGQRGGVIPFSRTE